MGEEDFDGSALDKIMIQLGDFGKYQMMVLSLVCITIIFNSAVAIDYVFRAMNLDYRCKIPGCDVDDTDTEYEPSWLVNAVPYTEGVPQKCDRYEYITNGSRNNCVLTDFNQTMVTKCTSYIYKTSEKSILQEYNLQCNESLWKMTMVGTMNNIGQFVGIFISGLVSDWYGRKVVLIWGMVLSAICGLIRILMPSYGWFLTLEFITAAFSSSTYMCGFVLGVELVGPKSRVLAGVLLSCCFAVGEIFAASSAWIIKSWKGLSLIIYIPSLFVIFFLWFIPESVRWYLSKGRIEEAKTTLKLAAKTNGIDLQESTLEKLHFTGSPTSGLDNQKVTNHVKNVLKSNKLVLRTVNCCFCWMTTTFLFYGLSLNSVTLAAGNSYLNFILTAMVELPTYVMCNYSLSIFGRRKSLSGSFLITGAACLCFLFVPSGSYVSKLILYLIGKFGATAASTNIYVLTSEIFPTSIRHTFMGLCSTIGRVGSMVAPQVPLLAQLWTPLPLASFAVMSFLAGILSLLFPETLNRKLPDTIEEAENIGQLPKVVPIL